MKQNYILNTDVNKTLEIDDDIQLLMIVIKLLKILVIKQSSKRCI